METENNLERLAGWILRLGAFAAVAWLCWYFRSVLVYIIIAFVVSLMGQPVMRLLRKIRIKGKPAPDGLLAGISIVLILLAAALFVTQFIPVVSGIIRDASSMHAADLPYNRLIEQVNEWLLALFPNLGRDFDILEAMMNRLQAAANFSNVSWVIEVIASAVASIGVGLFSVIFISFFFIKDQKLFGKILCALVPERIEASVDSMISDITHLLSRYFIGLSIEVLGVIFVDFLGLWLIARIGADYAIGIAFIAGVLNVIPYVGPLLGEAIGVLFCVVLKYGAGVGLPIPIWAFALVVLAIMLTAQLIDNFVYQPLIYSTSIKATPLEIFIVLLLASRIGGTVGLLVGIPAYTVVRVIAIRFYSHKKAVRRLIPDLDKENTDALV